MAGRIERGGRPYNSPYAWTPRRSADPQRTARARGADRQRPQRGGAMSAEGSPRLPERDRPWMMRTYAGHSTATASNELYRRNLQKGQTGLSVAFDLPTQTGYDPDDELARGEVGKVGVPTAHGGDMAPH